MSSLIILLHHGVCRALVIFRAFVGSVPLSLHSVIHSVSVPVPTMEPGTGESTTLSTNTVPVLMQLTFIVWGEVEDVNRNMQWGICLNMEKRMGY